VHRLVSPSFAIRRVTTADLAIVARHRAEMFTDMGTLPASLYATLVERSIAHLEKAVPSGEYVGWLVTPEGRPQEVLAGAGVLLRRVPPHPSRAPGEPALAEGRQALVINVFTEAPWRRRGLALLLMEHLLAWCGERGVETVVLHASDDGRPLYERLGFVATNEMRLGRRPGEEAAPRAAGETSTTGRRDAPS
jgi:GNAT superfamily N-acetyltransferase